MIVNSIGVIGKMVLDNYTEFEYYTFGVYTIVLTFDCGSCKQQIVTDEISVPQPNFSAGNHSDSQSCHEEHALCKHCGKEYIIDLCSSFSGGNGTINGLGLSKQHSHVYVHHNNCDSINDYELNLYIDEPSQYDIFENHLTGVKTLLEIEVPTVAQRSLLVMLHAHLVSAIEGFLAGVFIHNVTRSEDLIRKLVESDPEFSRRKFTLKEIYEKQSTMKLIVGNYLRDMIFHDLKKVIPMYKSVISHDFGNIEWLFDAVMIRHHCVHRAGYDKDHKPVNVTKETIITLLNNVWKLALSVEESIMEIELPGYIRKDISKMDDFIKIEPY